MELFGSKKKNYDAEIARLDETQKHISARTDENKSDIVALGLDFSSLGESLSEYKIETNERLNEVLEFIKHFNSDIAELKKWREETRQETIRAKKAKSELPDTLTYEEVSRALQGFTYLDSTSFKYYLYENGILDLKINRIRNTYKISEKFNDAAPNIKKYIHVTNGAITFGKDVLEFLINNPQDLQRSIDRYIRKQKQFNESKQRLSEIEIKNFQREIGIICGTRDAYNKNNWKEIYRRYESDHKGWSEKYDLWADKFLQEHPNYKYDKPSKVMYLVQEVGDGDVLLKIACELFVV